jgi:DNA-nicking Smr family endonuclease
MRRVTAEERELFLAALSGRLPAKTMRAVAKAVAKKAADAHLPAKPAKTAGPRRASDEEVLQFLEAIGLRAKPVMIAAPLPAPPAKRSVKGPASIDGNTKRKLDKGEIVPGAKLDLHGMTEAAAHGALVTFLAAAHARGDRLVLVVTGKGEAGRGVLKQMVPRWLEEAPMAKRIAEKRPAHRRHGGEGALYVYLRKSS